MAGPIQVRFDVSNSGAEPEIRGSVVVGEGDKIVFVNGYKQNWKNWRGPLPQNGEEWVCEVIRDTSHTTPRKGALLVRLLRRADKEVRWDCGPGPDLGGGEIFGARPAAVTYVIRVGLREERADSFLVHCPEDIRPDWPENVRAKAAEIAAAYQAARRKFEAMIQWPKLPRNDPGSREIETEVGGYKCRFRSAVSVGPDGLVRCWRLSGPVFLAGPVQVLTDKVRAEPDKPGKSFVITRRFELEALCALFGTPKIEGTAFESSSREDQYFWRDGGTASWSGLRLDIDPAVLFEGGHEVAVTGVSPYGDISCRVTLPDLEIEADVSGFGVLGETQQAATFFSGRWQTYENVGFVGDPYRVAAVPAIVPAHVNGVALRYLTAEQRHQLVAGAPKWSLADHQHYFRAAMLGSALVKGAEKHAGFLGQLVASGSFAIRQVSRLETEYESESPDGMRGGGTYTYTVWVPALAGDFGEIVLKDLALAQNLDAAIRQTVFDAKNRVEEYLVGLRQAFAAKAHYRDEPAYPEPAVNTVSAEERQEVDRKASELLVSLQAALDAGNAFLAQEDYTVRLAKKAAAEKAAREAAQEEFERTRKLIAELPQADPEAWEKVPPDLRRQAFLRGIESSGWVKNLPEWILSATRLLEQGKEAMQESRENLDRLARTLVEALAKPVDESDDKEEDVAGYAGGTTSFVEIPDRYFRCAKCGGMARLTRREMDRYKEGEPFELTCPSCGATGTVQRS